MYKVKYLQEELTSLFRTRILEDGNPAEDAMDYLGNIDFHALTQAVQDKARTAYTYITQGMQEKSFNYIRLFAVLLNRGNNKLMYLV